MKKYLLPIILLTLCLSFGCAPKTPMETDILTDETTVDTSQTEPLETAAETAQAASQKPEIVLSFYVYDDEIAVSGTLQTGAYVTARAEGYEQTQPAQGQTFFLSLPCGAEYQLTATAPGCSESDPVSFKAARNNGQQFSETYVGGGSQLFLKAHIADFEGTNLFSGSQLSALKHLTEQNIVNLRAATGKSTRLIYLIVPDPQSLYPELAPDSLKKGQTSRTDQFVSAVSGIDGVTVVDLTDTLTAHKSEGMLIKQTDSHWSELAGFYAYEALHKELLKDNPELPTYSVADFEQVKKQSVVGNYITDKTLPIYEEETYLHPKFAYKNPLYAHMAADTIQNLHIRGEYEVSVNDTSLPTCLFVRDSFSTCVMKYMAEDFSYMFMQEMWVHKINIEKAGQIKPDYVIHLLLQNNLGELLSQ